MATLLTSGIMGVVYVSDYVKMRIALMILFGLGIGLLLTSLVVFSMDYKDDLEVKSMDIPFFMFTGGEPTSETPINETPEFNSTHKYIYDNESKTWIIVPKDEFRGGGEGEKGGEIPIEPTKEIPINQTLINETPEYNETYQWEYKSEIEDWIIIAKPEFRVK